MLNSLITSQTRIKLLRKFFLNNSTRAHLRGLDAAGLHGEVLAVERRGRRPDGVGADPAGQRIAGELLEPSRVGIDDDGGAAGACAREVCRGEGGGGQRGGPGPHQHVDLRVRVADGRIAATQDDGLGGRRAGGAKREHAKTRGQGNAKDANGSIGQFHGDQPL